MRQRRYHRWAATGLVLLLAKTGSAQDATSWQPPPPPADESDWVQLESGEWLKGEIVELYDEELTFDSDDLDLQVLDWEDVRELRSARVMTVLLQGGELVTGRILVDERLVRISGAEERELPRSAVVTMAPGRSAKRAGWSGKMSLGANLRGGNTRQIGLSGSAGLTHRSARDRFTLDLLGSVDRTEDVVINDNQRVTAKWGRVLSRRTAWAPLFVEWFRDPFANVAARTTLGTGVLFRAVDEAKVDLELLAGVAYQEIRYARVEEDASRRVRTPALVLSLAYDRKLTGWMDFELDHRAYVVNAESGRYSHHMVAGLEVDITAVLELGVKFTWDRVQRPEPEAPGVIPASDDLRLAVLFGVDF